MRCKICSHPKAGPGLIQGAREAWSPTKALTYARTFGLTFTEPTWYTHRKHVGAAGSAPPEPPQKPARLVTGTTTDLLEQIRDLGLTAIANGTIKLQARDFLKAVELLEKRNEKNSELSLLMRFVTGHAPPILLIPGPKADVVEGEAIEIPVGD